MPSSPLWALRPLNLNAVSIYIFHYFLAAHSRDESLSYSLCLTMLFYPHIILATITITANSIDLESWKEMELQSGLSFKYAVVVSSSVYHNTYITFKLTRLLVISYHQLVRNKASSVVGWRVTWNRLLPSVFHLQVCRYIMLYYNMLYNVCI